MTTPSPASVHRGRQNVKIVEAVLRGRVSALAEELLDAARSHLQTEADRCDDVERLARDPTVETLKLRRWLTRRRVTQAIDVCLESLTPDRSFDERRELERRMIRGRQGPRQARAPRHRRRRTMTAALRRWWQAPDPLEAVERHIAARAEGDELLHLGALLHTLHRQARDHLVNGSEQTRLRLRHACDDVEMWADGIDCGEVRTTALYCVQQGRRAAGPVEEAAPLEVRLGLLEELMWAWAHAHQAIRARARELDALRGHED